MKNLLNSTKKTILFGKFAVFDEVCINKYYLYYDIYIDRQTNLLVADIVTIKSPYL